MMLVATVVLVVATAVATVRAVEPDAVPDADAEVETLLVKSDVLTVPAADQASLDTVAGPAPDAATAPADEASALDNAALDTRLAGVDTASLTLLAERADQDVPDALAAAVAALRRVPGVCRKSDAAAGARADFVPVPLVDASAPGGVVPLRVTASGARAAAVTAVAQFGTQRTRCTRLRASAARAVARHVLLRKALKLVLVRLRGVVSKHEELATAVLARGLAATQSTDAAALAAKCGVTDADELSLLAGDTTALDAHAPIDAYRERRAALCGASRRVAQNTAAQRAAQFALVSAAFGNALENPTCQDPSCRSDVLMALALFNSLTTATASARAASATRGDDERCYDTLLVDAQCALRTLARSASVGRQLSVDLNGGVAFTPADVSNAFTDTSGANVPEGAERTRCVAALRVRAGAYLRRAHLRYMLRARRTCARRLRQNVRRVRTCTKSLVKQRTLLTALADAARTTIEAEAGTPAVASARTALVAARAAFVAACNGASPACTATSAERVAYVAARDAYVAALPEAVRAAKSTVLCARRKFTLSMKARACTRASVDAANGSRCIDAELPEFVQALVDDVRDTHAELCMGNEAVHCTDARFTQLKARAAQLGKPKLLKALRACDVRIEGTCEATPAASCALPDTATLADSVDIVPECAAAAGAADAEAADANADDDELLECTFVLDCPDVDDADEVAAGAQERRKRAAETYTAADAVELLNGDDAVDVLSVAVDATVPAVSDTSVAVCVNDADCDADAALAAVASNFVVPAAEDASALTPSGNAASPSGNGGATVPGASPSGAAPAGTPSQMTVVSGATLSSAATLTMATASAALVLVLTL